MATISFFLIFQILMMLSIVILGGYVLIKAAKYADEQQKLKPARVKKPITITQKVLIIGFLLMVLCIAAYMYHKISFYQIDYTISGTLICSENYSFFKLVSTPCPVKAIQESPKLCYMVHQAKQNGMEISEKILGNISLC